MQKRQKIFALVFGAVLLVGLSVFGTMAYLTASKDVLNTFTVGQVEIKLDEALVDSKGEYVSDADERTSKGNSYHLIPGAQYVKDPTVTLVKGSEKSYLRILVDINKSEELDMIFAPSGADLMSIFGGFDNSWIYMGNTEKSNVRTYEFHYKEAVKSEDEFDLKLPALFETLNVPQTMTNEQLAKLNENFDIKITAHAIQAQGFDSSIEAWSAFLME